VFVDAETFFDFVLFYSHASLSFSFTNIKLVAIKTVNSVNDFRFHIFVDFVFKSETSRIECALKAKRKSTAGIFF
jgi:hypothetical protein